MKNKAKLAILGGAMLCTLSLAGCSASFDRAIKDTISDFTGGLNRTVTVYNMNGEPIKTYNGKLDIEMSDNKVKFDLNGKRIVIYNATVLVEEQ